jgi:hypothetical protein
MSTIKECCGVVLDRAPRCFVPGCPERIVAEVHHTSYRQAWKLFSPSTAYSHKPNSRIFVCEKHLHENRQAQRVLWQRVLFVP